MSPESIPDENSPTNGHDDVINVWPFYSFGRLLTLSCSRRCLRHGRSSKLPALHLRLRIAHRRHHCHLHRRSPRFWEYPPGLLEECVGILKKNYCLKVIREELIMILHIFSWIFWWYNIVFWSKFKLRFLAMFYIARSMPWFSWIRLSSKRLLSFWLGWLRRLQRLLLEKSLLVKYHLCVGIRRAFGLCHHFQPLHPPHRTQSGIQGEHKYLRFVHKKWHAI